MGDPALTYATPMDSSSDPLSHHVYSHSQWLPPSPLEPLNVKDIWHIRESQAGKNPCRNEDD